MFFRYKKICRLRILLNWNFKYSKFQYKNYIKFYLFVLISLKIEIFYYFKFNLKIIFICFLDTKKYVDYEYY